MHIAEHKRPDKLS
jgi:hypothetical protein